MRTLARILALPLAVLALTRCNGKDDDTSGATASETASDSSGAPATGSSGAVTTGAPTTSAAPSLYCEEAIDEAECDAAIAVDEVFLPCLWVPFFKTKQDGGACTFTLAGGRCLSPMPGDTGCSLHEASCGFDVYSMTDALGTTLARIDDGCVYYFLTPPNLVTCTPPPDPIQKPFDALACSCACAADYPG